MSEKSAVRPLAIRFSVDIVCSRSERRLRAQRRSLDFSLRARRETNAALALSHIQQCDAYTGHSVTTWS
jgi:hypothetical protein